MTITDAQQMLERWRSLGEPAIPLVVETEIYDLEAFLKTLASHAFFLENVRIGELELNHKLREFLWRE